MFFHYVEIIDNDYENSKCKHYDDDDDSKVVGS